MKIAIINGRKKIVSAAFYAILFLGFAAMAFAQTSVFTYQGKLTDGGVPANGSYDMRFRLFDAATVGSQVGSDLAVNGVQAAGGIFSVEVDFGTPPFTGADRFLEIAISPAGQNNFTTLAPRQRLNSAPYAMKSLNAETSVNSLSLGGTAANQFVQTADPRMSDARAPLPGSNIYVQNGTSVQAGTNFNVAGSGTASIFDAATQFNLGGSRILSNAGANNLFAGVNAGLNNTSMGGGGFSNSFVGTNAGMNNTIGNQNTFVGSNAGMMNVNGLANSFFGAHAGSNNTGGLNSFFGWSAGFNNTDGQRNAFFGRSTGLNNTTGGSNSFYGAGAGFASTTGNNNSFLGDSAGNDNTTGSNNVFIGANSGNPNVATQVSNSVAIGANAVVSTSNSIVLGTAAQVTRIPGHLRMSGGAPFGNGPGENFVAQSFSNLGFSGIFTNNLLLDNNALNNVLPSQVHVCIRTTSIGGGLGGEMLTRCTSPFTSANDKIDVRPYTGGIDVIMRLKPLAFRHKSDGSPAIGLNSEDVAEIDPSLVTRDEKLSVEKVDEGSLSILFINAFKEQQKQIDDLLQANKKLAERLLVQERRIEELKKIACGREISTPLCEVRR